MIAKRLLGIQKASSPPAPAATDVYYDYRSLILNMQGTAGSKTFTDSSPNNLAITAYGNAQLVSDATFGTVASFDGSGDYLTATTGTPFQFSGDFTVEFWIYPLSGGAISVFDSRINETSPNGNGFVIGTNSSSKWVMYFGSNRIIGETITTNTWTHVALSRSGTSTRLFLNGTQTGSTYTDSTNYSDGAFLIGTDYPKNARFVNGRIGPLRISPWAVYTANFTPSQELFPAVQDSTYANPYYDKVALQLKFDGTNGSTSFVDTGPNALAVTPNGNAQITSASKYGSGAGAFDGNGDRLNLTSNAAFGFGTGDFTVEFWVYFNSISTSFVQLYDTYVSGGFSFYWSGSTSTLIISNRATNQLSQAWSPSANTWYHLAVSRSGTSLKLFVNGTVLGSATASTSYAQAAIQIGGTADSASYTLNGSIDELEVTKGVAKYKSNFTPPARGLSTIYNPYSTLPVSGAALWLDGADSSTLFTDAGVTPVNKSGDLVYQWSDKSGNNRHATQATSGNRPTWVPPASGQNGFGAVSINGSQWLGIADDVLLRISTGMTFFAVVKFLNWSSGTHQTILEKGPHANGLNYVFGKYNSPNAMKFTYNNGSFRDVIESTSFNGGTTVNTLAWRVNKIAATVDFRANGLLKSTVNDASNLSYPSTSTTGARVGINGSSSESMTGSLMELVLYPFEMTDVNIAATESYLRTKWRTP